MTTISPEHAKNPSPELEKKYIEDSLWVVQDFFRSQAETLREAHGNIGFDTKDADNSPVTKLDRAVERDFKKALRMYDPDCGFLGEEYGSEGSTETYWLIDPIDGTRAFIEGREGCSNMATLVHHDKAVAAVVYDFLNDTMYSADADGAYENGEPISTPEPNGAPRIFIESKERELLYPLAELLGYEPADSKYRYSGMKWVGLAKGEIDATLVVHGFAGLHDLGPAFIAQQAGVSIKGADGTPWRPSMLNVFAGRTQQDVEKLSILADCHRTMRANDPK